MSKKFKTLVFENIGAASMCWSETPAGTFETRRAEKLANEIVDAYDELLTLLTEIVKEQSILDFETHVQRARDYVQKGVVNE